MKEVQKELMSQLKKYNLADTLILVYLILMFGAVAMGLSLVFKYMFAWVGVAVCLYIFFKMRTVDIAASGWYSALKVAFVIAMLWSIYFAINLTYKFLSFLA